MHWRRIKACFYVYQSIIPLKKANSTLAEQVCDPCNLSKRIHYHLLQLIIVDSNTYDLFQLDG